MIGERLAVARFAAPDLAAKRGGAAVEDVLDGAPMRRWHRRAVGPQALVREAAEDVRDFDHGRPAGSEADRQPVENAAERNAGWLGQMRIDRGGRDVGVSKQDLHDPGIDAIFQQAGGVAVA